MNRTVKQWVLLNTLFLSSCRTRFISRTLFSLAVRSLIISRLVKGKGKAVPLQTWCGPEGSRKLRFPDFMKKAHDGGKVVSLTHRSSLPPGNTPGTLLF